ncbi:hypothetical protein E4U43_008182 [Claviceps pusilla]|uniref:Uncharacterized protein n=1 Tax=Claviceps pusilla TaxID=123648 RepID=A0A9P7SXH9_9HYPO|nr:hypothetical protein E4U43_008182 [Claviceps pusilla]
MNNRFGVSSLRVKRVQFTGFGADILGSVDVLQSIHQCQSNSKCPSIFSAMTGFCARATHKHSPFHNDRTRPEKLFEDAELGVRLAATFDRRNMLCCVHEDDNKIRLKVRVGFHRRLTHCRKSSSNRIRERKLRSGPNIEYRG